MFGEIITFITRLYFIVNGQGTRMKVREEQESKIGWKNREKESLGKNHIALSSDPVLQRKL